MSTPVEIEFLMRNRTKPGLTEVESGLDAVQQEAERTQAVIYKLWEEMMRLKSEMSKNPQMDQSENIAMVEALRAKIEELQRTIVRTEMAYPELSEKLHKMPLTPKDLPKATSSFNGLNVSIQQIAREMPALAMGPQMFFLAISNNLPIFADELARARREYDALIKSGQKGTPVWKQLLKSLFSWQTAMSTAIMLTVMYGKEIGNWIAGLFGATDAVEQNREAMQRRLEVEKDANAEALKTRFNIRSTIAEIERFNGTKEDERRKVEELNNKYGETFGYYDTLAGWYDTLCAKAEEYVRIMFMQAKAQSLLSAAVKADEKMHEIEAKGPEEYRPFFGKGGKMSMFFGGSRFNQYGSDPAELAYREAFEEQKQLRDDALRDVEFYQNQIRRLREGNDIDQVVDGSIKDLENTIAAKRRALKNLTNKADYDTALKEIKTYEDRLEAITGGKSKKKKTDTSEQSVERLSDMEIAARQRVEEQVVALMKEGYDKQRAEADLNFRKEKERIDKEERERLALYDKLKASGAKVDPAARLSITGQAATQRIQAAQIRDNQIAAIDKKEEDDNRKRLEKLLGQYRDYAAQRAAIEKKHNEAIAAMRGQLSDARMDSLGKQMIDQFSGNVNLLARPMIDAAKLAEKGWKDAGEGIATVFSSQFGIEDASGKQREVLVTPILPDGSVLSEEELKDYVDNTLNGAENILQADSLGIVIAVDVDPDGTAGEHLHRLQEAYYDIKQNVAGNALADGAINRAIVEAERVRERELGKVDAAEAASAFRDNDFLKRLFGDYSSMSFGKLQELIAQAKQLRGYLSGNGSAEGITFISPEDLARIEKSPSDLDRLRKALDRLLKTGKSRGNNTWENIFQGFETGIAKLKGAKGFNDISDAVGTIGGAAADAAGSLSDMFDQMGDTETADAVRGVQQVMGAVANIGKGFAEGGIVGGIGATIGTALNFIGQAFAAEARHREALKEIDRAKLDFQRAYNLALLEQNLLLKEASNIFGERQILKAANAVQNYREALAQFKGELAGDPSKGARYDRLSGTGLDRMFGGKYSAAAEAYRAGLGGLYDAKIVTGHKKTGLFGWGKGKDLYSSVLSVYPELIDANGELDTAMLQSILDTRKMSKETRSYLENLISLTDAMEEAEAALEDYLQQTFGSLGDGVLDAVKASIGQTGDMFEEMAGSVAATLEQLGEQVAYSLFFADKFDQLQDQLKDIYGSGKSEEEIARDAMDLLGTFYAGIGSNMEAAESWMEEWRKKAEEMGFDLWQGDGVTQSGKAGAFTTLTQDQGTKLEGLMTALQMHGASLDEKMDNVTVGLGGCLDALARIAENTNSLPLMLALMQAFKRDGIKVK